MNKLLHRFWFEFELKENIQYPWQVVAHYGVTAYNYDDAINILENKIFFDIEMPNIKKCVEDIDIRLLDQGHVIPNMGVPVYRGIWFPLGFHF